VICGLGVLSEGLPEAAREWFRKLYDELCGVCHPTAFSLSLFWDQAASGDATVVRITSGAMSRAFILRFIYLDPFRADLLNSGA
jgi:hypothetical protein